VEEQIIISVNDRTEPKADIIKPKAMAGVPPVGLAANYRRGLPLVNEWPDSARRPKLAAPACATSCRGRACPVCRRSSRPRTLRRNEQAKRPRTCVPCCCHVRAVGSGVATLAGHRGQGAWPGAGRTRAPPGLLSLPAIADRGFWPTWLSIGCLPLLSS
jgi:hypothetical protein